MNPQDPDNDRHAAPTETLLQSFAPVTPTGAQRLILGSMPGVASLKAQQYYAHPRNGFWKILQAIYGGDISTYDNCLQLLADNHIALWDSLQHCQRPGSLDSNIVTESVVANNFEQLLQSNIEIKLIAFNGKAAEKWFRKLALPTLSAAQDIKLRSLPSSSPAMASLTLADKVEIWRQALTEV